MKAKKLTQQRWMVKNWPFHIRTIRNPLPEIQLIAIKSNLYAIEYIKKPSRAVQLYVAKKDRSLIKFIKTPCEDLEDLILFWEL